MSDPGLSLWRQIERAVRADIADGTYAPGARLPTEAVLAQRFQVNRHTVRQALAALRQAGLIRAQRGRGTFVAEAIVDYALGPQTRFTQNVRDADRLPGARILRAEPVRAPDAAAQALRLPPGARAVEICRIGLIDGRPATFGTTWLPPRDADALIATVYATGSLTAGLAAIGIADYRRAWTRVSAQIASGETARHLELARGRPVLMSESLDVDPAGAPIGYSTSAFAADRIQLLIDQAGPDQGPDRRR